MGTSRSITGPGQGVGLVPPWLNIPNPQAPPPITPVLPAQPGGTPAGPQGPPQTPRVPPAPPGPPVQQAPPTPSPGVALPKRFSDARRSFGSFVSTGDRARLRSGLGSYVRKGYRGSSTATARMGQAATSAGRAYDVLSGLNDGRITPQDLGFNPATLAGTAIEDIIDALVDAICVNDTTLDDAAGREAVNEALSEVLEENPTVDPLRMPTEHTTEVWIRTTAYHVFQDIMRDLGPGLQRGAAGNAPLLNERRREVRDFVRESYREQYNATVAQGTTLNAGNAATIARSITQQVFSVYEGWMG